MRFTAVLTSALAGLAVASPAARPNQSSNGLQQRGVLAELCIASCLAAMCGLNPPVCAACLVTCVGTASDDGEVVLDLVSLDEAVAEKVEGYTPQFTQA